MYASGNVFVFYEPRNQPLSLSPNILVAFGVERRRRLGCPTWEEGKARDFSWCSRPQPGSPTGTASAESTASPGVREYFLFDPTGEHIKPVLRAYRLGLGGYVPLVGPGPLAVRSGGLGLDLWVWVRKATAADSAMGDGPSSAEESETKAEHEEV